MAWYQVFVCLSAVVLVACGEAWTRTRDQMEPHQDSGNILSILTSASSPDNVQILRERRALPSLAGAAINYQEFVQDKQGKEVKKPEKKKEIKTRLVKSYFVIYEKIRSD